MLRAIPVMLLFATSVAACSDESSSGAGDVSSGSITVFAAASLTDPFTALGEAFHEVNPNADVELSFAASSALVGQIRSGAPADVIATADESTMEQIADSVTAPVVFARNSLAIIVAAGNPLGITSLSDLAEAGVTLVICSPEVPCGKLAATAFENAGVSPSPKSLEQNVKAVVSKVTLREADAGVVYVSDIAAAGEKVEGVDIAADENVETAYPIALVESSSESELAAAFIELVLSDEGARILADAGFDAP